MNPSFLKYLADPKTGESFELVCDKKEGEDVIEGVLESPSNRYPIVRGIPRFAGYNQKKNYAGSFGYEWNRWARVQFESENIGKSMQGFTLAMWESITGMANRELSGVLVGDFGCGSGRFIEIVRMKRGKIIGLDLSNAVEVARENFKGDPDVLICQADVLEPPIKANVLDMAFSIGVLHHTLDAGLGFKKMALRVKPGGDIAAAVYGRGGYYSAHMVNLYRHVFKALWFVFKHYPPLIYSYMTVYAQIALRHIPIIREITAVLFPYVYLPDIRWSLLDTFDSVTPSYQSSHEFYEVFQWFKQCGITAVEPGRMGGISLHGVKSKICAE